MRTQRVARGEAHDLVEPGLEVAERMMLEAAPGAAVVGCFVMTRGAQRAWEAINEHLHDSRGALFWIGGPGGAGKTHFLNYVIALNNRAGALNAEPARHLTLAVEIAGRTNSSEIERRMVEMIAHELAGDAKAAPLWRRMRGAEALAIALDHARRQGVKTITAAIDFGAGGSEPAARMESLARIAVSMKNIRLTVIAAGRDEAPQGALAFNVAPEPDEEVAVAIGRARRLGEASSRMADVAYRGTDIGDFDPRQIFPFHPGALDSLAALCRKGEGIAAIAAVARAAIEKWIAAPHRLIFPADLMRLAQAREIAEMRLGENGRAALGIGYAAAESLGDRNGGVACDIVNALMLRGLGNAAPLDIEELGARIPSIAAGESGDIPPLPEILEELAAHSRGVIVFDPRARTARFDASAAGAPEVAAFSAALDLARRFDSTLAPAHDSRELKARFRRLNDAMASALEGACRNRETLAAAMGASGAGLSPAQERVFADFCALAETGARALIDAGGDAERRAAAMRIVADYEALAALAAAAPRLRAMREYLHATGLRAALDDNPARDRSVVALETECQLLLVSVNPAALADASHGFDALEARFQKFKWTYVQHYRAAHERWRIEMERVAGIAGDARRHLDALRRLNSIAALGLSEGNGLEAEMGLIERRAPRCDLDGPLSPEITPRCPRCAYVLGAESPREDLDDLFVRAKRALQAKLATLSRGAIWRLIRQHDHNQRLKGFLKITQAAQTDALVRVLDDELVGYLGRLIDENAAAVRAEKGGRGVVRTLRPTRLKSRDSTRTERHAKSPANDSGND
jgi:hypothetical protein